MIAKREEAYVTDKHCKETVLFVTKLMYQQVKEAQAVVEGHLGPKVGFLNWK